MSKTEHQGRSVKVAAAINAALAKGDTVDAHALKGEYDYANLRSITDHLNALYQEGVEIVRVDPKRHVYALKASAHAQAAARKYAGRPGSKGRAIIPNAWVKEDPKPPKTEEARPLGYGEIVTAVMAVLDARGIKAPTMAADPAPRVDLVAMAEAAAAPVKVIVICPDGCPTPQIVADGNALYLDGGNRRIEYQILKRPEA